MSNALLKYVLVRNSLPEATAPYLGRLVGNGNWDSDAFAARIAAKQPELQPATVRLLFQTLFSVAAEAMAEMPCRVSLGAVTFEPAISGSLPSMDAQLGDENEVYVAVRLSDALRNAAAGVSPVRVSEDALGIRLDNVQDESASANGRGTITGTEPFTLTGLKITGSGDGESVKVVAADGTEAIAVDVADCGTGQRITARLATALPAGRGRIYLTTYGFGALPGHGVITRHIPVTIAADETPPGPEPTPSPTITGAKTQGDEDDHINVSGGTLDVTGENLETATAIELLNDSGELWQTVEATYADGKLTAELEFEDRPSATGAVRVTTAGGSATHNVSYSSH